MREFLGIDGYQRPVEGFLSWQHLTFVTSLVLVMIALAVFLGRRYKNRSLKEKNKVLIWSAILIDAFEIFKIVIMSIAASNPWQFVYVDRKSVV